MRITRETLLKIARDTAAQRARASRDILCIYLTGSLTTDQPLLGGVTDIDLIIVHGSEPPVEREVLRLKFQNGLSYAEISRVTQLTVSNVGFLIHTAMKTLRAQMQKEEGFSAP